LRVAGGRTRLTGGQQGRIERTPKRDGPRRARIANPNDLGTLFRQKPLMSVGSEHRLTLRQADEARADFAIIEPELEAIHAQLAQMPTRLDLWRGGWLGMLGGSALTATLGLALFAH
jgi:hypothetical protein